MKLIQYELLEFLSIVKEQKYNAKDTIEAKQFGHKSVQDAFRDAELAWARFYTVEDNGVVLAAILEQRDGNIIMFTTQHLKTANIREYIKILTKLGDDIIEHRDVIFIRVAGWYKEAQRLLKCCGLKPYIIENRMQIWVKENGK